MGLVIRPTELTDAFYISACVGRVAREDRFFMANTGFDPIQTREYLSLMQTNGGVHMVLQADSRIVGWCEVNPWLFKEVAHAGRLGIGLLPEFRGIGWGRRLLLRTLAAAFEKKIESVEVEVLSSNRRAIMLYRDVGFHEEGRRSDSRKDGERVEEILLFRLLRKEWTGCG